MKLNKIILIVSAIWVSHPVTATTSESISLDNWTFTAYQVDYSQDWTAKLTRSESSTDNYGFYFEKNSAAVVCMNLNGRSELSSPDLNLKPFTWYGIEIEYQTQGVADSLITLAGLYPDSSRFLMDLVILPPTNGDKVRVSASLHTGLSDGPYHFFLGNTGLGTSLFYNVRYREMGEYTRPTGNLMIVDLLELQPDVNNLQKWRSVKKFTHLFGFSEPTYIHPLQAVKSEVEKADPKLIVFSPTATDTEMVTLGKKEMKRHNKGISTIIKHAETREIPVLGICAGHQSVAQHYGAFLARLRDDQTGDYLSEIGPTQLKLIQDDAIFESLQGNNTARIVEAHMVVVGYDFELPENLAVSKDFGNQIFRYDHVKGTPWYTFQGHIEKDWEFACPEGAVIFNNLLHIWGFIQSRTYSFEDPAVSTP